MILPFNWHGAQHGDVLVFGNSLGTTQRMWHRQVEHFADRYRILTFDLPGHYATGHTQHPFSFDDIVESAADLLHAQCVSGVRWCGVSLGGALGVAVAARHPSLVGKLALVNAPIRQPSREFWIQRALDAERSGVAPFADAIPTRWFASRPGPDVRDDVAQLVELLRAIPRAGYAEACRAIADMDVTNAAADIAIPTVVIYGEADLAVAPDNSRELAERIGGADLRSVPGAGHMLPVEMPGVLNTILDEFLSEKGALD